MPWQAKSALLLANGPYPPCRERTGLLDGKQRATAPQEVGLLYPVNIEMGNWRCFVSYAVDIADRRQEAVLQAARLGRLGQAILRIRISMPGSSFSRAINLPVSVWP